MPRTKPQKRAVVVDRPRVAGEARILARLDTIAETLERLAEVVEEARSKARSAAASAGRLEARGREGRRAAKLMTERVDRLTSRLDNLRCLSPGPVPLTPVPCPPRSTPNGKVA